ncbi:hypothetical protein XF14_12750 [Burkholderia gladioli]|nr:hypothetical protein XF14_12750 [Burkholderia gladioli]
MLELQSFKFDQIVNDVFECFVQRFEDMCLVAPDGAIRGVTIGCRYLCHCLMNMGRILEAILLALVAQHQSVPDVEWMLELLVYQTPQRILEGSIARSQNAHFRWSSEA